MSVEAANPNDPKATRQGAAWPVWVVSILFAVLYSYALWAGVGNAVGVPQGVWENYHLGISVIGWVILVFGVLLSPVVFVACLLLGRGRGLIARALIYAAGLCVVSAVLGSLIIAPTIVNFIA
ncbi:MAG TPA: hypothetical protein VN619_11960 [Lacisediminihabitans sp.]|nr:hypothetical protein [Lacisediminihabitans sp.]HXD62627.1 hypothetical protein [Lacisediminihabitans sp.]